MCLSPTPCKRMVQKLPLLLLMLLAAAPCCSTGPALPALPVAGAALGARLRAMPEAAPAPPTWVSVNPLSELAALPKVHYAYQGIDGSYINGHPNGLNASWAVANETMVDYARIMGSFPALMDRRNSLDTAVEIVVNASRLHPTGRLPVLQVGDSPLAFCQGASPMNMTIEARLEADLNGWQRNVSAELAASNARLGTSVVIGAAVYDVESWSWANRWRGAPPAKPPCAPYCGGQVYIDQIRRKAELIFNITAANLPGAKQIYYNYGSSGWSPQGVTEGCFNLVGCSVDAPDSCDDGWCTDTSYTFNESFIHDSAFDGFSLSLYEPCELNVAQRACPQQHDGSDRAMVCCCKCSDEPQLERDKFRRTAANARAAGVFNVRPTCVHTQIRAAFLIRVS